MTSSTPVRASDRGWFVCLVYGAVLGATCLVIVLLFQSLDDQALDVPTAVFGLLGAIGGVGLIVVGLLWALLRVVLSLDRHTGPADR